MARRIGLTGGPSATGLSIHLHLSCYLPLMQKKPSESKPGRESAVLGARAFAAISAVEGLALSPAGRKRVNGVVPIEQRRADVIRAYTDLKGSK